jgi:hypothetical protein
VGGRGGGGGWIVQALPGGFKQLPAAAQQRHSRAQTVSCAAHGAHGMGRHACACACRFGTHRCCSRASSRSPTWSTSCGERSRSSPTYGT